MTNQHSNEVPPLKQQKRIAGRRFGRLVAVSFAGRYRRPNGHLDYRWNCVCDCGNTSIVKAGNLKSGHTTSCGCFHKEETARTSKLRITHGMTNTRLHSTWAAMKDRCFNPKATSYRNYGDIGITVCPRWRDSFEAFAEDMGEPPSDDHTLDRIDNCGDYAPDNCRWATHKQQSRNRRDTLYVEYQGRRQSLCDWSEESGIPYGTLKKRIFKAKWDLDRAFTEPVRSYHNAAP